MEYIAALDLGTSKMLAMVASKNDRQEILATEQIESGNSIRRGLIHSTTEVSSKIVELIRRLNQTLKQKNLPELKQVYVSIGGQGLHTETCSIERNIDGNIVDDSVLEDLRNECRSDWSDSPFELDDIISPEYYLDGHLESQPQGVRCKKLKARFQLVLGHFPDFKTEVKRALQKVSVELTNTFVAPLATAEAVLTEAEKENGCALVEWGAGVTYLSIYDSGLLRHLAAIPIGGEVITKDICSLNKEIEAEGWKISEGCACSNAESNELNNVIEARVDEIVDNILHQIKNSNYGQTLNAGFVLTGGASRLNGLDKLLEQRSDKPVRRVKDNPEQSCVRGLLQLGNENCAKEEKIKQSSRVERILGNLFETEIQPKTKETKAKKEKAPSESIIKKVGRKASEATEKAAKGLFD